MHSRQLLRIGFFGAGRVGQGLAIALGEAGHAVVAAGSRSRSSAEALAARVPGCVVADSPQSLVNACDLLFLTVPDDAIATAAASLPWRRGVLAVHTSGAAELAVLDAARQAGADVGAFHPLVMFSDPQVAARALAGSTVAVEAASTGAAATLESIARGIGANPIAVPAGARGAYHASAHYAAGFLCVLMNEAEEIWRRAGIGGPGDASRALLPLARGALEAVARDGPAAAMQGAIARGDIGTVKKHLQALGALDPSLGALDPSLGALDPAMDALYRSIARRAVDIALGSGRIDAGRADELQRLLHSR